MMRKNKLSLYTAILSMCAFSGAQTEPARLPNATLVEPPDSTSSTDAPVQLKQRDPRYRLRKSDTIYVKFKFSPELNQLVTVQPDGFITLDEVGDIKVEGETLSEVKEAIRLAFEGILHDPVITILLDDFEHPFFLAGGQVKNPGKYELRSDITLSEAVAIAGGFTEASKHSQVVLFRRLPNDRDMVEARVFNVKHMLSSRNLQEDPHLMPGDMLFVPQNTLSKIQRYIPTLNLGAYFPIPTL